MASTRLGFVAVEHARARGARARRFSVASSAGRHEPARPQNPDAADASRAPRSRPRGLRARRSAPRSAPAGGWIPVRLGTPARVFSTPEDLMAHFADALASTPRDTDIHDRVMLDALRAHPDARAKIGAGAACLQVRQHASKRYDSFVVVRADGTFDDFSYRKCVEALFPGFAKRPKTSASTRDDRLGSSRGDSKPSTSASTAKAAAALNAHISKQASVESLLAIVRERADELDRIHVAAAFVRLGKIVAAAESPFGIVPADSPGFQTLVDVAKSMCTDDRGLDHRGVASVAHAIARVAASGAWGDRNPPRDRLPLAAYGLVVALERRVARVAASMSSQATCNTLWAFATLRWELGAEAWDALEAAVARHGREAREDEAREGGFSAAEFSTSARVRSARGLNAQETSVATWAVANLGWDPCEDAWRALDEAAIRNAPRMTPQAVSNTLWGFATLGREPSFSAMTALERAVVRVAPRANLQDVANLWWAYVTLEMEPDPAARAALETAVTRLGPRMTPRHLANQTWAFSMLARDARAETWAALERAETRVAPDMSAEELSATMLGYATNARRRTRLRPEAWRALETATVRVAPDMNARAVSHAMWARAALGFAPEDETRDALEDAVRRTAPTMDPQNVANAAYAYAKLGVAPGAAAFDALDDAAGRTASSMNAQNVSNALWSFLSLVVTRDVPTPRCYPSLWRAASALDVKSMLDLNLAGFFHARLIHDELLDRDDPRTDALAREAESCFPDWLDDEAKAEWTRGVFDDVRVSRVHGAVASALASLGVDPRMECLTDDECFSLDLYLPEHDVAVEVDGPTHYARVADAETGDRTRYVRTTSTELRDAFLRKRHAGLVVVPWFEFEALGSRAEEKAYLAEKLERVGVRVDDRAE